MANRRPLVVASGSTQELTASDTLSVPGLDGVQTSVAQTNAIYVPAAASLAQDPFSLLWHDSLAFSKLWGAPTYTVSTDGSTSFGAGTLDPKLFANKEAHTSVTVADTATRGARWQWNSANIASNNGVWLVLGHAYGGATAPTKTITVESSTDGSAWTTRHTSSYSNTEVPVWHYITGWNSAQWLRVTIVWTAGDTVKLTSMRLLTPKKGDQGGGPEYSMPITWSADGTMVGIGKGITAPTSALDVTGNAVISGTLSVNGTALATSLSGKQATDQDLTDFAALTPTNDDIVQRKAGAWANRTLAQLKTDLNYQPSDIGAFPKLTPTANKTSAYTAVSGDLVMCDDTGGTFTVTLPAAVTGAVVGIKKLASSSFQANIARAGTDTIGAAAATSIDVRLVDQTTVLQCTSTGVWTPVWNWVGVPSTDSRYVRTSVAQTYTAVQTYSTAIVNTVVALTDAATIAVNAALGNHFRVTLAGNRAMGTPTNPVDGQKILFEIIQDATGSRTMDWATSTAYVFGTDVTSPTLTTTASKTDFVGFVYNSTAAKWRCLAVAKGY